MRTRMLLVFGVVVGLLAVAPTALGATTKQVSITSAGFSPKAVSITADDSIGGRTTTPRTTRSSPPAAPSPRR